MIPSRRKKAEAAADRGCENDYPVKRKDERAALFSDSVAYVFWKCLISLQYLSVML